MKPVALALVVLFAGCIADTPDTPPIPEIHFSAGRTISFGSRSLGPEVRVVTGSNVFVASSWYGICHTKDITSDKERSTRCEVQSFTLTTECLGAGCIAPKPATSNNGEVLVEVLAGDLGTASMTAKIYKPYTSESLTRQLQLRMTAPDAIRAECFVALGQTCPRRTLPTTQPTIQLMALLLEAEEISFSSNRFTVNGEPVMNDLGVSVFDLRAAFPANIAPDGSLRPGSYDLDIELAGKVLSQTFHVVPE